MFGLASAVYDCECRVRKDTLIQYPVASDLPIDDTGQTFERRRFGCILISSTATSRRLLMASDLSDDEDGELLQDTPIGDTGEMYVSEEEAINRFLKLHPMCSLESTDVEVMSAITSRQTGRVDVVQSHYPVVSKSYEDMYLRPPRDENGERPCNLGELCMCNVMARVRYGPLTDEGFTCVEFMLPEDRKRWQDGNGLPEHGKCLVCTRYFASYVYVRAESDPLFLQNLKRVGEQSVQTYQNPTHTRLHSQVDGPDAVHVGSTPVPNLANPVNTYDGYSQSAMLPVDMTFADTAVGKQTTLGALAWRPMVRFNSAHYEYTRDADTGERRIVQVGIGCDSVSPSLSSADAVPATSLEAAVDHNVVIPTDQHLNSSPP